MQIRISSANIHVPRKGNMRTAHHLVERHQLCNRHFVAATEVKCALCIILYILYNFNNIACALCNISFSNKKVQLVLVIVLYSFNNTAMRTAYHLEQLRQYCNVQCPLLIILYSFNYIATRTVHYHLVQLH